MPATMLIVLVMAAGSGQSQRESESIRVVASLAPIEAALKERIDREPARARTYLDLASIYETVGHEADAERVLRQWLTVASRPGEAYGPLIAHLKRRRQYEGAIPIAEEWRRREPASPDPHVELAWLHLSRGATTGEQRLGFVALGLTSVEAALAAKPGYGPAFDVKRQLLALKWILSDRGARPAVEAEQRALDGLYTPPPRSRPARSRTGYAPAQPPIRAASGRTALRVGGDLGGPARIAFVEPRYPQEAIDSRIQGEVGVEVLIDEAGAVHDARAYGAASRLADAALEAVRQWRYEPTVLYGRPVPVLMSVRVEFVLTLGSE